MKRPTFSRSCLHLIKFCALFYGLNAEPEQYFIDFHSTHKSNYKTTCDVAVNVKSNANISIDILRWAFANA